MKSQRKRSRSVQQHEQDRFNLPIAAAGKTSIRETSRHCRSWGAWSTRAIALLSLPLLLLAGCETDSFLDMSEVGRWERTPTILPILTQLDIVDEPAALPPGLTQVTPEDLIPEVREYVLGPGDLVTVTVFELIMEGTESVQTRRVDNLGMVRLPVIGPVQFSGKTPSELEYEISDILVRKNVLRDPTVSVIVQEARQNTYTVIGEPRFGQTAFGTYAILKDDFRLLDAVAQARGIPGSVKTIYVFRKVDLYRHQPTAPLPDDVDPALLPDDGEDAAALIEELMRGEHDPTIMFDPEAEAPAAPEMIEAGVERETAPGPWINIGGRWVRAEEAPEILRREISPDARVTDDPRSRVITQRIIQVPYDRLFQGDMRFNIVIRPDDVIQIPPPSIGNIYVEGHVSRPGTYGLPGDGELTLMNLIAAAGGLGPLAVPERVDLIRRIPGRGAAWVRVNLRAIYHAEQPDILLKPNDQIIVGTNIFALPTQVIRSGFRTTYGFGFLLDRNFGNDVFGAPPSRNN
jgi:polysaccharide biosynthesis/export protein